MKINPYQNKSSERLSAVVGCGAFSEQQIEVMRYAFYYVGGTVDGFCRGGEIKIDKIKYKYKMRSRKSGLALIIRTYEKLLQKPYEKRKMGLSSHLCKICEYLSN